MKQEDPFEPHELAQQGPNVLSEVHVIPLWAWLILGPVWAAVLWVYLQYRP